MTHILTPSAPADDPTSSHQAHQLATDAAAAIATASGVATHDIALTLGSGWGGAASLLGEEVARMDAGDIPGFHRSAVAGHGGYLSSRRAADGTRILIIGARTHLYEGRGTAAVAHPVRVASATGAQVMVLTNGCGGLNQAWTPGTPVVIRDHINLTGHTPLRGATFVDLTNCYDAELRALAHSVGAEQGINLDEGVYAQFPGPQYETPAEVKMAGILGADLVGMSTTLETIAAREAGMRVLGISLVTNLAAGITGEQLNHAEVLAAGKAAEERVSRLLAAIVGAIGTSLHS